MADLNQAPDEGLPRGSISIGASIPALESLARSSWPKLPHSVRSGEHDQQFLFNVTVNVDPDAVDFDVERVERQISWYLENKNSASVRRDVRKAREQMKYETAEGDPGPKLEGRE